MRKVDVAVIGGGPAGLAAALAAKKAGAGSVLVLERDKELGGILQQCIHNGFGLHYFGTELTGPEYAARFIEELAGTDIEVMTETFVLNLTRDRVIHAISAQHGVVTVEAGAVVLAMGCRERTRGALNIPGTRPAGIYTAGCAQRLVNIEGAMPGREVVVLGSGDIGLIMARRMTWEGARVKMVCELMPYSSGLNRNIVQCLQDYDIPLHFNTTVVRIHGRERLEGVTIARVDENRRPVADTEQFVACDTLLLSVGLIPENELTDGAHIEMDPVTSGAIVDERRQTSAPGIFACGNVLHVHDLVDNVSVEAGIAGTAAAQFASATLDNAPTARTTKPGFGVRYIVPQKLHADLSGKVSLYFRVDAAYKNPRVIVESGGSEISNRPKVILTPGEMERIDIDADKLSGDVTIRVQPKEGGASA